MVLSFRKLKKCLNTNILSCAFVPKLFLSDFQIIEFSHRSRIFCVNKNKCFLKIINLDFDFRTTERLKN